MLGFIELITAFFFFKFYYILASNVQPFHHSYNNDLFVLNLRINYMWMLASQAYVILNWTDRGGRI